MKRHSVSVRINLLILLLVIIIGGGLVIAAYLNNSRQVDDIYMNRTTQTAATIAEFLDGNEVQEVLDIFLTDEYQALRKEAAEAEDDDMIARYLTEKGIMDEIEYMRETLSKYRDLQGAEYVYLISVMKDSGISVCDPDEPLAALGVIAKNAGEFGDITSNTHIDPTVSSTEYGWLCSAYEPVRDSAGNAVCLVGVDIDMTDVMNARQMFLQRLLIFSCVVGVVAVALGILIMRKTVTKPLKMLSKATDEFADNKDEYTRDDVINLPIKSKDEIGDLYRKSRMMQLRLVDYMDNLTQVTMEKEHISTELNVANRIQADMLPRIFPPFPDRDEFDIFAMMHPAKEVGGDFYDFFLVDDDHLALVVADVSGKGVPAALFMVIAKTLIKNRAQMGDSPSDVLQNVNNQLCEGNEEEFFVTVWLGILEISTGNGWAVNAGHENPVIRRGKGPFELIKYKHSPAVAVMEDLPFRQHEFHLDPGDSLFVYTDGVPEATNAESKLFGNERMLQALNARPDDKPENLLPYLRDEINAFVGDAPQFDDITMLMVEYRGPKQKEDEGAGGAEQTEKTEELEIEATVENLEKVQSFLEEYLGRRNCPGKVKTKLQIAAEEIFVNIAHYAYGGKPGPSVVRIGETHDPEGFAVTFIDEGTPYDPLAKQDPDVTLNADDRPIGGLGIYMVKKSMNEVTYEYKDGRNMLTLKKGLS